MDDYLENFMGTHRHIYIYVCVCVCVCVCVWLIRAEAIICLTQGWY